MSELNQARVEKALRGFLAWLDYDLHKYIECDETDGTDHYAEYAREFIRYYKQAKHAAAQTEQVIPFETVPYRELSDDEAEEGWPGSFPTDDE